MQDSNEQKYVRKSFCFRLVKAAQSAALALDLPLNQLRRGMVLTSRQSEMPKPCQLFQV